ncbi:MAG: ABC transporter permease [Planctomycetota bacterium]
MSASSPKERSGALGVLAAALAVARKELVEGFRDRQTLIYTFVLPVCMYPAMFWVMVQGVLVVQGQKGAKDVSVGLVAAADDFDAARAAVEDLPESGGRTTIEVVDALPSDDIESLQALVDSDDEDAPDALLVLPADRDDERKAAVYYDSTDSRSEIARERVERRLSSWADELRNEEAERREIDPDVLDPFDVRSASVAEKKDEGALVLSLMLPMLLVVMCVLGAFFPAVDLTAGEKERHTAETTMLLPLPRLSVHLGKIFAVCAASIIATALNLLALGLSAGHLLGQLSALGEGVVVELPLGALAAVAPLAVLFAFFVSAALTGLASLAASFKEGQALLGPVQMLFIMPAVAASLPGIELDAGTAWIPVVNVALAFRGLLVGDVETLPLVLCAVALTASAALAIWFSVRLLSNEEVALSGETLSMGRLFRLLRAERVQS